MDDNFQGIINGESSWVPFGSKAFLRGKVVNSAPFITNIGCETFLEMDKEEVSKFLNPDPGETKDSEFDIREELTELDIALLEMKGKPRVAHQPQPHPVQRNKESLERALQENLVLESVETVGMVVERDSSGPVEDPSSVIVQRQIRESLFKRKNRINDDH